MKKIANYETAQPYTDAMKLPPNGYVIGILGAEEMNDNLGVYLHLTFDICEGEQKNFYTTQYKSLQSEDKKFKGVYKLRIPTEDGSEQDGWTLRRFKTVMCAIEDSNPGYHWDWNEKALAGKVVGAIFYEKEYDFNGKTGFYTTLHSFKSADKIRSGDFKVPPPKLLQEKPTEFTPIIDEADLPF